MSNAQSAHGTLIARNTTTIGELRDITPPPLTRSEFDVTNQNDSDDSYVVGVRRKGALAFAINFLQSGEATHGTASGGLMYAYTNKTLDVYKITFPDGATWSFSGYVTNIAVHAPVDGALAADVTIRPTGATVFTS